MRWSIAAVLAVLAIGAPSASAASVTSIPGDTAVLFALEARGGTFKAVPGRAGHYTLVMRGMERKTTWFADRPRREAGRVATRSLLRSWKRLGFAAEPPNVAVVVDRAHKTRDTVALELRLRGHDSRRRTARFSARVLDGLGHGLSRLHKRLDPRLPKTFAAASMFIDDASSSSCALGQPRLFGFSWVADGSSYIRADGRLLPIAQYPELFAFYGTRFGGDGEQTFRAPDLEPPLEGTSWQVCADGAKPSFRRMPDCSTGQLVLWSLGKTPLSAVEDYHWLPADGRTVETEDYPTFAARYRVPSSSSTFALPDVDAPPGFVYLVCTYGNDDMDAIVGSHHLGQVDLFLKYGYVRDYAPGGVFLPIAQNQALFEVLGTTYGGDGKRTFVIPTVPTSIPQYAYFTAYHGLFPRR